MLLPSEYILSRIFSYGFDYGDMWTTLEKQNIKFGGRASPLCFVSGEGAKHVKVIHGGGATSHTQVKQTKLHVRYLSCITA